MQPPNFGDTIIKQEIAMKPLPEIILDLKNHKLHKTKDLYKALYEIHKISLKYNIIKSYHAKTAMKEKGVKQSVVL